MPLIQNINTISAFCQAMGERSKKYSDAGVRYILDYYNEMDMPVVLDSCAIASTFHEASSVYELCDNLFQDATSVILAALDNSGELWTGSTEPDASSVLDSILQDPPVELKKRYPDACDFWLSKIEEASGGDVNIADVEMDFLLKQWDEYDELNAIRHDPTYGKYSKAMQLLQDIFVTRYSYDTDSIMDYVVRQADWTHDYSGYKILSNGHILYW